MWEAFVFVEIKW